MKAIYKLKWSFGSKGDIQGIFIEDIEKLNNTLGKEIYFGEVLGKHSEIYGILSMDHLKSLTEDQDFITKFIEIIGDGDISGYNPMHYIYGD